MAFEANNQRVTISLGGDPIILYNVSDIGEVDGFPNFIGFWKEGGALPFYMVSADRVVSMDLEENKDKEYTIDNS